LQELLDVTARDLLDLAGVVVRGRELVEFQHSAEIRVLGVA
jgi:hypothetical protein